MCAHIWPLFIPSERILVEQIFTLLTNYACTGDRKGKLVQRATKSSCLFQVAQSAFSD